MPVPAIPKAPVEDVMALELTNNSELWRNKSSNHGGLEFVGGAAPRLGQGGLRWRTMLIFDCPRIVS